MLRSGRSRRALPIFVLLSACLAQTAAADRHSPVPITIGHARHTVMPRVAVAIGEILPGAEPFVAAPASGTVTSYSIVPGEFVARGAAVATLQPAQGPAVVVRAPLSATVTGLSVAVGGQVTAGTPLAGLRGHGIRRACMPFAAAHASHFTVGETVYLHSPLNPRDRLLARIVAIKPSAQSGVRYVYTDLPPLPGFTPGSPVRADLILAERTVISVPSESVVLRPPGTVVFVVRDHRVHEQVVTVQIRRRHRVAVSGLSAGTRVAASALDQLHNGTRVRLPADS